MEPTNKISSPKKDHTSQCPEQLKQKTQTQDKTWCTSNRAKSTGDDDESNKREDD